MEEVSLDDSENYFRYVKQIAAHLIRYQGKAVYNDPLPHVLIQQFNHMICRLLIADSKADCDDFDETTAADYSGV